MALTGIQIFKLLPKTNCGECGVPTCLAFAMSLAAGKVALSACPHVSEAARAQLSEAAAPPIKTIVIGSGERAVRIGGETVMFRHEKRFENPPGIAITISDAMDETEIAARLERSRLQYERVGLTLRPELIAVRSETGDGAAFAALVARVAGASDAPLILMSLDPAVLKAGLAAAGPENKPLLYAATAANLPAVAGLAHGTGCPLVVKGGCLAEAAALSARLTEMGVTDLVIDSGARGLRQAFEDQVLARRAALVQKFRPLGYPTICLAAEMTGDPLREALIATTLTAKYGGLIVLSDFRGESLFPLLVARMNLFTDPQRPLATTQGIYEIGSPDECSPVLVTANFSLTYFLVAGEIESSKVPSWLLIKDTEGLSVLTAWAAGKFSADTIAPFVKQSGIADRVRHHQLIIPGYLAGESGALAEELPGWEILVGPREGSHIPAYLKTRPAAGGKP